jgi:hypothetical protein
MVASSRTLGSVELKPDVGARTQRIEGDIGIKMIEWAVNEQIPLLSVHDANAAKKEHQEKKCNKMKATG